MFLAKVVCENDKYFVICSGDVAAYLVYVYKLYPLQGDRSTQSTDLPARDITDTHTQDMLLHHRNI